VQYVRLAVGAVRTETKIVKHNLNPEWNQVFAVGKDKIQGRTLELTVWDAVSSCWFYTPSSLACPWLYVVTI